MVPTRYNILPSLPLLPSGKLDRARLLDSLSQAPESQEPPANELESAILGLWVDLFGHPHFGVTDDFFETGGDSLMAAELTLRLNSKLGVSMSVTQLTGNVTVRSIATAVQPGRPAHFDRVIRMNRSSNPLQLFAVHGEGNIYFYGRLARLLNPVCNFYAIQAYGLDRAPIPFQRMEECASDYVRQIQQHQHSGPYLIGGYCFGGFIAFEMARQLHQAGHALKHLLDMCSEGYELHRVKDGDCFMFEDPCVNHLGNILASKISRSPPGRVT
jgi:hypothetical protein